MIYHMFLLDKYRKGRKYNNASDTSLREFSDLNKRHELKENRESNKEWKDTVSSEDVKPEFIECSTKVNFLISVLEKMPYENLLVDH